MIARTNPTDFISIGTACVEFGLSAPTLRSLLDRNDNLSFRSVGGHRRVSRSALKSHLGMSQPINPADAGKKVLVMTRVSTPAQKTSLVSQKESCLAYCAAELPELPVEINESIRSGMHVGHAKFVEFIINLTNQMYSHVVVNHSERICRSSLPLVRALCEKFNVQLHIVNKIDDKDADDFVADILAYTMYYNAKYNSSKSAKLSRIEVSEDILVKIYLQYRQGMSYKDLSIWCEAQGIVGTKGQKLTAPKLHQMFSRNQKVLEELVPPAESHISMFISESIVTCTGGLVKQVDVYAVYLKWCAQHGHTALSAKKMGLAIKQSGIEVGRGMGGMKLFKGIKINA